MVDNSKLPTAADSIGHFGLWNTFASSSPYNRGRRLAMFDPYAHLPRINRGMIYLGACLIAGIRLARERQVNVRVIPTSRAIDESVELAHEIYNRVFSKVPEKVENLH
jgi:hypothetical protein